MKTKDATIEIWNLLEIIEDINPLFQKIHEKNLLGVPWLRF